MQAELADRGPIPLPTSSILWRALAGPGLGRYDIGLPGKFCLGRDLGHSSEWNIERNQVFHRGASKGGTARKEVIDRVFRP